MRTIINYLITGFLSLYLLMFTSKIHASDYYIDQNHPAANDQNSGTIDQPWKTLEKGEP